MIKDAIAKLIDGQSLSRREAYEVMEQILAGTADEAQISAFLVALQLKGGTVEEVAGSVDAYRERITPLSIKDPNAIDTSGTGGDNLGTFNISTTAAFVAAGAGARVIKHGYNSVTSQCGSADVLESLGVATRLFPDQFFKVFEAIGLAFLFAPRYKPSPRNFATIRQHIGARTFIHLLDPLTKPAITKRHLIGVYDKKLCRLMAEVLREFDIVHAMIVHGDNGLDEVSISGETHVVELKGKTIREYVLTPEELGLKRWPVEDLVGGDAEQNKRMMLSVLKGNAGGPRDVTIANAAAALLVAEVAEDLADGVARARDAIDSGAAMAKLEALIEVSAKYMQQ